MLIECRVAAKDVVKTWIDRERIGFRSLYGVARHPPGQMERNLFKAHPLGLHCLDDCAEGGVPAPGTSTWADDHA
jgi:hypothetical protein